MFGLKWQSMPSLLCFTNPILLCPTQMVDFEKETLRWWLSPRSWLWNSMRASIASSTEPIWIRAILRSFLQDKDSQRLVVLGACEKQPGDWHWQRQVNKGTKNLQVVCVCVSLSLCFQSQNCTLNWTTAGVARTAAEVHLHKSFKLQCKQICTVSKAFMWHTIAA